MIERLRAHYGFGRTPFGRDLAPGMLHPHRGHAEAVARIAWLISERAIGVVTGEVGAGKTVAARAAVAGERARTRGAGRAAGGRRPVLRARVPRTTTP